MQIFSLSCCSIWQIFVAVFGKFSLQYLVSFYCSIWQVFVAVFGKFSLQCLVNVLFTIYVVI